MKHRIKDIKKIELFAPGTAGERALRIETADGVEIYDENNQIEISKKQNTPKVLIEFFQDGEDYDSFGYISFIEEGGEYYKKEFFDGESLFQIWRCGIEFLKEKNLPHPNLDDLEIKEDNESGHKSCYWEN